MNKFDKIIYDRYMHDHPIQQHMKYLEEEEVNDVYKVVDFFYKGSSPDDSKFLQALSEVNRIKMIQRSTRGNIWRSVQAAHDIVSSLSRKDDVSGPSLDIKMEDFKASLQNLYTGEEFDVKLKQSQDNQNKADLLLYSPEGEGELGRVSDEDVAFRNWLMQQAQTYQNIQDILDCFGMFLAHANKLKREKWVPSVANLTDITMGDEISRLVPDELLQLAVPELEDLFNYKYATKSLLQYDSRSKENVGKGDMVFLLDISGSMYNPLGQFTKLNVACGFLLAMLKVLEEQGRNCKFYTYNTSTYKVFDSENLSKTEMFKTVFQIMASGGTNITQAFQKVFNESDDDVVLVSDGVDPGFSPSRLEKGGRRVSCLLISEFSHEVLTIKRFVDSFILANDMGDFNHLIDEFL